MDNKKDKESQEVRIPIPNMRFLFTGIKKTDNSWSNDILDPATGERRTCGGPNLPNAGMLIMISILTNKIFTNNKKQDSIEENY